MMRVFRTMERKDLGFYSYPPILPFPKFINYGPRINWKKGFTILNGRGRRRSCQRICNRDHTRSSKRLKYWKHTLKFIHLSPFHSQESLLIFLIFLYPEIQILFASICSQWTLFHRQQVLTMLDSRVQWFRHSPSYSGNKFNGQYF